MTLVKCPACKTKIYKTAKACPTCGRSSGSISPSIVWLTLISVTIFILVMSFRDTNNGATETYQNAVISVNPKPIKVELNPYNEQEKDFLALIEQPQNYIGQFSRDVAWMFNVQPNEIGTVVVNKHDIKLLFEATNQLKVSYIEIAFNETAPCHMNSKFDDKPLFLVLNLDKQDFEFAKTQTYFRTYYDHINRLKITTRCPNDGAALQIAFSSKNYLQ